MLLILIHTYRLIHFITTACYDELAVGYEPTKEVKQKADDAGEPIPVMFIPRKPHPNCLLIYLLATYLDHPARNGSILPFVLNILPHLKTDDASPQQSVIKAMEM